MSVAAKAARVCNVSMVLNKSVERTRHAQFNSPCGTGDWAMMGERTVLQESLFHSFNLDRHVPMDHLLRSVDRFVDLSGIRQHLQPYYSEIGRPSIRS